MEEEQMAGGVNTVSRRGERVHRPSGPWTQAVFALLDHLAANGFRGAPRAHGLDEQGREVVDFLEGVVPGADYVVEDDALAEVAALLREFHDATLDFVPPPDAAWYFEPQELREVICHGDVAPYNMVFRGRHPVALIDFDTAHPGPRVWDVAYAAYRFVPLTADAEAKVPEQGRRLRIFADAYGLGVQDREELLDNAIARLHHLIAHMRRQAEEGHPGFSTHIEQGHDAYYLSNIDYIQRHRAFLTAALG